MKKSRIVVHLSLEDLRNLGVIKKIYKRRKSIAKPTKETYDFGFKNNPDQNLYNKQYPNYFQNTSNLQNENTRLQNDKLTQEINTLNQGFNNNNDMDNKIRHLEDFKNRAINWFQTYNPDEQRFAEIDNGDEDDDDNGSADDNFQSQENNFNTPHKQKESLYDASPDQETGDIGVEDSSIKRLQPFTEDLQKEMDAIITLGNVNNMKKRYQSNTKVNLLTPQQRTKPPDDINNYEEPPYEDSELIGEKMKYKDIHKKLNEELIKEGITNPQILNSTRKATKIYELNKAKRNKLVEKYHILDGFKKTQGKTIDGMNKLIAEQISILKNPNEKQKEIISMYYNNE